MSSESYSGYSVASPPPVVIEEQSSSGSHVEILTEHYYGNVAISLEKTPIEILSVTYCGIELNPKAYAFNELLYIFVDNYGIEIELDDEIRVIYTAKK